MTGVQTCALPISEIITLIEFPFELMSDLQGEFWKLTEKELIWIRATTKRSIDKIPIKLLETLSWVGFPVVLAYVVGKRIRHMWKITGTGREEERASEGEQQETTREGEKKLMIKKGF